MLIVCILYIYYLLIACEEPIILNIIRSTNNNSYQKLRLAQYLLIFQNSSAFLVSIGCLSFSLNLIFVKPHTTLSFTLITID